MSTRSEQHSEFEAATASLRPELLAHCYRMMGSVTEAEDQVQETYLRAWRAFHDFEGRSSVRTWMYRIATNSCLNSLSSASRRVLPTGLGGPPGDPTEPIHERPDQPWLTPLPEAMLWQNAAPTPEEQALARENITVAWVAALQHLPPNQRAVLVLRDVLGFTAAETAEALATSVASVNSALQRSRATVGDGLPAVSDASPEVVEAFVDAFERHDFDAVLLTLADEVTWQMPPFDRWYLGPQAAVVLAAHQCPAQRAGDLRFLPARANGQPAVGMYLDKGNRHEAFQFLTLRVNHDGLIDEVVGWFEPHLFRLAGLPIVLEH